MEQVAGGSCGVRPAAERAGVPHTAARGWLRRFRSRAAGTGVAFAALAVELGGEAISPAADAGRFALAAIRAAFGAACALPGWAGLGVWRVPSAVGGRGACRPPPTPPPPIAGGQGVPPPRPPLSARGSS